MDEIVYALIYKKYSLNAVKIQILSQLLLVLFICILSLITFEINGNNIVLSNNQILLIASYLFIYDWRTDKWLYRSRESRI